VHALRAGTLEKRVRILPSVRDCLCSPDLSTAVLDAALGEILTTAAKADYIINYGEDAIGPESRNKTNLMLSYKRSEVHYEPLGTVAAIVSWNYRQHPFVDYLWPTLNDS
jgi:acyl-CoA reductase-like NAD-dependent aldehyde dehydrogenase